MLCLISLLIDDIAVIGDNCANLIFFLFSSDAEYLVVNLNCDEFLGKDLSVAYSDRSCSLGGKIMDHHLIVWCIVVVETRLLLRQNEVRFEADHVVQEASELVYLASHDNVWPTVLFKIILVILYLLLVGIGFLRKSIDRVTQFKDSEEISLPSKLLLSLNTSL